MSESCISCLEMNVYVLFIIDRESDIENGDNSYGYYGKSWCLIHLIQFKENIEHHTCSESYFSCFFASLKQYSFILHIHDCMKFFFHSVYVGGYRA